MNGLIAASVALLSVPTSISTTSSAWNAAKGAFEACRAEEVAYDQAIWMPAFNVWQASGTQIPRDIDAEMDRLIEARCDAEDVVIATPAPDLSAIIWKMEYATKRWEHFCGWPDDWSATVIDDLRRLAGGML